MYVLISDVRVLLNQGSKSPVPPQPLLPPPITPAHQTPHPSQYSPTPMHTHSMHTHCTLLLGEGNFSFALGLATLLFEHSDNHQPHSHSNDRELQLKDNCRQIDNQSIANLQSITNHQRKKAWDYLGIDRSLTNLENISIIATSFDSLSDLKEKYPDFKLILARLARFPQVQVLHKVNAWDLVSHFPDTKFNVIAWNHPHLGKEDFRLHRFLMSHFFHSCAPALVPDAGFVAVSLVQGQEQRWDLVRESSRALLGHASFSPFIESDFPGYVCKRNKNGESFKNARTLRHMEKVGIIMLSYTHRFDFASYTPLAHVNSWGIPVSVPNPPKSPSDSCPSNIESAPSPWACPQCSKPLASEHAQKCHIHMVHTLQLFGENWSPSMPKTLLCDVDDCPKAFCKPVDLWQHQVAKHSEIYTDQAQSVLTSATTSLDIQSLSLTADDSYDYIPCPQCTQAIHNSSEGLFVHLESLKPLLGQQVICPIANCGKVFTESRAVGQHWRFCRLKAAKVCADGGGYEEGDNVGK